MLSASYRTIGRPFAAILLPMLAAFVLILMSATIAEAQRSGTSGVHVCSRYGASCVSAPVRSGRNGLEVRLPGGTWIDCKRDCRNTLREETIDFFETIRERAPGGDGRR